MALMLGSWKALPIGPPAWIAPKAATVPQIWNAPRSAIAPYANGPTMLQTRDGEQVSWDELVHHFSGKVVYVDIWASWCGPCREQTPSYEALKEKFSKDSVVFLNISIDDEAGDWKEALDQMGLGNDPHTYLLLEGRHSSLNSILHIKGVPRYVLLDKTGKIVDKDAPFPSDVRIIESIRKWL